MTEAINYDHHITNLIDELDKTGHVTHTKHKKTSVTFHHNAGVKVPHRGILGVWRTRPASAHFDVDATGQVAQFVRVDEYAWAVGNTEGNQSTISIEMADISGDPHWEVSETTLDSAARLAGWLFAHVIKEAPTRHNVFPHQHWSATGCPGPFVMKHFEALLNLVQKHYKHFEDNKNTLSHADATKPVAKQDDEAEVKKVQRAVGVPADGVWGPKTDEAVLSLRKRNHKP